MAIKSAKNGKVAVGATPTEIPHCSVWQFNETVGDNAYADSATGGNTGRVPGIRDVTGSFTAKIKTTGALATLGLTIGAQLDLKLYDDANTLAFDDTIIITSIDRAANIETGEIVGYTINFGLDATPADA